MSADIKHRIEHNGFAIADNVYTEDEISRILSVIGQADTTQPEFRKTTELFAVRQFLKVVPDTVPYIFNEKLKMLIYEVFDRNYFVVKSIYFDKPPQSNWFVASHQDLTISVDQKLPVEGFGPWTVKQHQYAVQPPADILENIFTVRIHLDDTDESNGALKVIPGSHAKGVLRFNPEATDEVICDVQKGGIMFMKPLLLHRSGRSAGNRRRRVIHIEFSDRELPGGLNWAEKMVFHEKNK